MEPEDRIIQEFGKKKIRSYIIGGIAIFLIVFGFPVTGLIGLRPSVSGFILIFLIIAFIVFSLKDWRCPACNEHLGKISNPKFCPHCGSQLHY